MMAPGRCELCDGPAWTMIDADDVGMTWACDEHLEQRSGVVARQCAWIHDEPSELVVMIGDAAEQLGRWLAQR